ncbi:hypothetical protein [Pseudomonas sp. WS 5011]|uniref:hypothetical protein n=1 Tax=Pseudomonas sp. WS 5011 TaxID=2717477 RepID=UPI001475F814|nr:hypothetical protein [Pseudomonas sp. WS 5011]NMY53048.1 hypothetical protein [Pseudomonas sp. WS 5011]
MDSLLREQLAFVAIRRLMQTILGERQRGFLVADDDVGSNPAQVLSSNGGFYGCFPDPMTWNQLYMRGMDACPYVDAFWRACHDVGLEFSPFGVIGFDERLERYMSSEEVFQQLGARIHFHWGRTELPLVGNPSFSPDRVPKQSSITTGSMLISCVPILGYVTAATLRDFSDLHQGRTIRF